jgi:hypothetical protein
VQLKLPNLKPRGSGLPPWTQLVFSQANIYSTQKKLNGKAKGWFSGIDTSPLGDMIALLFNILPTDVPMYLIPSERNASLLTTPFEIYANGAFVLPQQIDLDKSTGEITAHLESTI